MKVSFILAILVFLLLLSGCDSSTTRESIEISALYSGNVLEIPIEADQEEYFAHLSDLGTNSYGVFFETKKEWDEVLEIVDGVISEKPGSTIIKFTNKIGVMDGNDAVISIRSDGKMDYFLLVRYGSDQYLISTMGAEILLEGMNPHGDGLSMLVPLHFISDARVPVSSGYGLLAPKLYEGVYYELFEGIDTQMFLDFYNDSGWFDIKYSGGDIVLNPIIGSSTQSDRNFLTNMVRISFETRVGITYFSVQRGS